MKKLYLWFLLLFLYLPIIFLIVFSFNESKYSVEFSGFSFKWYQQLFKDESIMNSVRTTLIVVFCSSIFSSILGTIGALSIYNTKNKILMEYFLNLTYIPLVAPDIVIAISMLFVFITMNIQFGYLSLIISHIVFNTPFVVFCVLPALKELDENLIDAAMDLGAKTKDVIFKIILPIIFPNIITGYLLSIILSLDDFSVSFFTSGSGVNMLSVKIYSMTKRGISPTINALSSISVFIIFIVIIIYLLKEWKFSNKDKEKFYEKLY